MSHESLERALSALRKWEQVRCAYDHAMGVLSVDAATVTSRDTWKERGKTTEVLSQAVYYLII